MSGGWSLHPVSAGKRFAYTAITIQMLKTHKPHTPKQLIFTDPIT